MSLKESYKMYIEKAYTTSAHDSAIKNYRITF